MNIKAVLTFSLLLAGSFSAQAANRGINISCSDPIMIGDDRYTVRLQHSSNRVNSTSESVSINNFSANGKYLGTRDNKLVFELQVVVKGKLGAKTTLLLDQSRRSAVLLGNDDFKVTLRCYERSI